LTFEGFVILSPCFEIEQMATGNKKKFEIVLGKTGILIVVAGMTALLCAAFLFGVNLGKNIDVYPEKIAAFPQRVLALFWRPARIEIARNYEDKKNLSSVSEEDVNLTFHNTLTSRKENLKDNVFSDIPKPVSPPPETDIKGQGINAEDKIEQILTKQKSDEKKNSTADNMIVKNNDHHQFYIQAAALKDKEKAEQVSRKISAMGMSSKVVKVEREGKGTVFRVIVSGFDTKEEADKATKMIDIKTGGKCIVKKMSEADYNRDI